MFERFTVEAQRSVRAGVESAALVEHHQVEPLHLLLGCLQVPESLAATVLARELPESSMGIVGEAFERALMYGPGPSHQATGIFTDSARHLLAQDALKHAYRRGDRQIGTGHVLLAILDCDDPVVRRIVGSGVMGGGPLTDRIGRELMRALPGDEHPSAGVDHAIVQIDLLPRLLAAECARVVPTGWTVAAHGRTGVIGLNAPGSISEEDFRIDLSWIIGHDAPAEQRLIQVTRAAMAGLQESVTARSGQRWPAGPGSSQHMPADPHVEIVGDENPEMRAWFGEPTTPDLEIFAKQRVLTNQLLNTF